MSKSPIELEQRRHHRRSERVVDATRRLEKRRVKLAASEARLAELEATSSAAPENSGKLRDAVLLFNPGAGRAGEDNAHRLARCVRSLKKHGIRARVEVKTSGKAARAKALEVVAAGGGLIIVAAGDGTIGDVATALIGSDAVLGIIPLGTMNNLARSLGVPLDIDAACALIAMGATRRIDAGRVFSPESPDIAYFFDCAGVGLLAVAAVAGQAMQKRKWRVLPGAIRKFFEAKLATVQVELDGKLMSASTCIVTISNAPIMGNKLLCADGAKLDDGLLDIAVYDGMGHVALGEHFLALTAGSSHPVPTYQARHVRITAEESLPSSADMIVIPTRHVIEIEVVPHAVEVIVGNGIGLVDPVVAAPNAPAFAPDPPVDAGQEAAQHNGV